MRKTLLTLAVLSCSSLVSQAQINTKVSTQHATKANVEVAAPVTTTHIQKTGAVNAVSSVIESNKLHSTAKVARKAAGDVEAFYLTPSGILYAGFYDASQNEGNIDPGSLAWYLRPDFYVSARETHTFRNLSSYDEEIEHETVWKDGNDNELEQDENENGLASIWGANYVPEVTVTQRLRSDSYSVHGESSDGNTIYRSVWWTSTDAFTPLTSATMFGGTYTGYTGVDMDANGTWFNSEKKCTGFAQYVSAPLAHVYAESVYAILSPTDAEDASAPLNGETLTATIYTFNEDGSLNEYAKATATDENIVGKLSWGAYKLKFIFVEEDPFMGTVDSPVVLPHEDFMVIITGFENVAAPTHPLIQAVGQYGLAGGGYALLEDGSFGTVGYSNQPNTPQFDFNIGFDAMVVDVELANDDPVVFPVEGGLGISGTGVDSETGETVTYNDIDFYSSVDHESWEVLDAPEWITGVSYNENYLENGWMLWYLEAEALPEGVEGRQGEVVFFVYGKELTVKVQQGEVEEVPTYTVDVEQEPRANYAAEPVMDITEVAALLNAEPADLTFSLVEPKTGEPTTDYTGNPGELLFWIDAEGNNNGWDGGFAYVAYQPADNAIVVCPHPNTANDTKGKAVVRLTNAEGKYAEITLNIHFYKEEVGPYKPEIVKTIEISHLEKAAAAYCEEEPAPTFDVAEVCEALGIDNISEAKAYIVNLTDGNFVENTTDGWRNAAGDAAQWGQCENGFCLKLNDPASGEFDYTGAHDANFQVGDTFVLQWGLVANEKAVVLKVTVTFVEDPAGINELNADEKASVIYNVNGVRMQNAQQKGVYIVNGKKVVKK